MADKYLIHLTLDTGDTRRSPRSEVEDSTIQLLTPLVRDAFELPMEIPNVDSAHFLSGQRFGRCAVFDVVNGDGDLVVTFGVAGRSRCAVQTWHILIAPARLAPRNAWASNPKPPAAPWCAVTFGPALAAAADWLGDFERCVAWTFIELPPVH